MFAFFQMSGPWEWIIVLVIIMIVFGAGKLPKVMAQMGKGVRAFKDGVNDGDKDQTKSIEGEATVEAEDIVKAVKYLLIADFVT